MKKLISFFVLFAAVLTHAQTVTQARFLISSNDLYNITITWGNQTGQAASNAANAYSDNKLNSMSNGIPARVASQILASNLTERSEWLTGSNDLATATALKAPQASLVSTSAVLHAEVVANATADGVASNYFQTQLSLSITSAVPANAAFTSLIFTNLNRQIQFKTLSFSGITPTDQITNLLLTVTAGGSGTVTSVGITQPAAGITSSGGPITSSGNITLALANDLAALEALSGTGYPRRTGADAYTLDSTIPWGSISSTPTTLSGYSISDGALQSSLVSTSAIFAAAIPTAANLVSNNLNADNIVSGTVPTARLGTGTANLTTYLRGDRTWQTILTNFIREVIFTNDTANRFTTNTSGITFWMATNLMAYGSGGGTPGATNNQVLNGTTAFNGPATNQTLAVLTGNLMQGSNANWYLTTTSAGPLHFAASNFLENAWYSLTISNSVATRFGLVTNGGGGQVLYRGWRGIDANSVTRISMFKTYGVMSVYIDAAPGVTSVGYTGTNVTVDGTLAPFQRVILTNAAGSVVNVLVTNAVTDATTVLFHQGNVGNIQLSFVNNAMATRTNSSGLNLTTNAAALDTITFIPLTNGVVGANRIAGFQ